MRYDNRTYLRCCKLVQECVALIEHKIKYGLGGSQSEIERLESLYADPQKMVNIMAESLEDEIH